MTYRVGNHQPQNVYRESDDDPCPASVDGRCAESGEIHPPCKRGECRYDQTGARRGQYIGVMFTAEDGAALEAGAIGFDIFGQPVWPKRLRADYLDRYAEYLTAYGRTCPRRGAVM